MAKEGNEGNAGCRPNLLGDAVPKPHDLFRCAEQGRI